MTKNEALKLALEHGSFPQGSGVIHAIKEALAQPEQEPVAWMEECADFWEHYTYINEAAQEKYAEAAKMWIEKLRTTPPQRTWVGLTDEEIDKTHETQVWNARRSYARAIEAKLKQKNGYAEEKNT